MYYLVRTTQRLVSVELCSGVGLNCNEVGLNFNGVLFVNFTSNILQESSLHLLLEGWKCLLEYARRSVNIFDKPRARQKFGWQDSVPLFLKKVYKAKDGILIILFKFSRWVPPSCGELFVGNSFHPLRLFKNIDQKFILWTVFYQALWNNIYWCIQSRHLFLAYDKS